MIDKNGDGVIDYQEFMPVCFSMIVELLSDKVYYKPTGTIVQLQSPLGSLWLVIANLNKTNNTLYW